MNVILEILPPSNQISRMSGGHTKVIKKTKNSKWGKVKMVKNLSSVDNLSITKLYLFNGITRKSIINLLVTYVEAAWNPLVHAGPRYFAIELIVIVVDECIAHFWEATRITPKSELSHLGEWRTHSQMVQVDKEALLPSTHFSWRRNKGFRDPQSPMESA
jgi:hypothetical protein